MLEALALSVGALTSFVVAGVERNHREQKANPPMLAHAGYALCGLLGTTAVTLTGVAAAMGLGWL